MSRSERDQSKEPAAGRQDARERAAAGDSRVARLLQALPRSEAGAHVRQAVLTRHAAGHRPSWFSWLPRLPLRGWALPVLAATACAVVAVGLGLRGDEAEVPAPRIEAGADAGVEAPASRPLADGEPLILLEDPRMGLMHGLETFDRIGFGDLELVADWGR